MNITECKDDRLQLFITSDRNYLAFTAACCVAILNNTKAKIRLHILCASNIRHSDEVRFCNGFKKYGEQLAISFHLNFSERFDFSRCNHGTWHEATLYRILIPLEFPQYKKALYLDSDILVRQDVSEIFDLDMQGYFVAGGVDSPWVRFYHKNQRSLKSFGFSRAGEPTDFQGYYTPRLRNPNHYICGGLLLYNIEEIQKHGLTDWQDFISDRMDYPFMDQDALNIRFQSKIKIMPDHFYASCEFPDFEDYHGFICLHLFYKPWKIISTMPFPTCKKYWEALAATPYYYDVLGRESVVAVRNLMGSRHRPLKDSLLFAWSKLLASILKNICRIMREKFF